MARIRARIKLERERGLSWIEALRLRQVCWFMGNAGALSVL